MGLFSFLKNAGSKLFGKDEPKQPTVNEEEARQSAEVARRQKVIVLKGIVNSLQIPVENLNVDFYGDKVSVSGQTESQADREKVILALGNVAGVATVEDNIEVVTPEPEAAFYEVQRGDSLSKIAKTQYGDAMKYPIIFEANKPMLSDPDKIYPGQMLRIPPLSAN